MKRSALAAGALVLACNANDVVLYGPGAAGAENGEGAFGNTGASETGGSDAIGGSVATGGMGNTSALGGAGGVTATGGTDVGGSGNASGSGGTTVQDACVSNEICDQPSWYCSKAGCGDEQGVCVQTPVLCDGTVAPVCGCDHVTYLNDCVRESYGVNLDHAGECEVNAHPPCMSDDECGEDRKCAHLFPRPGEMNCSYRGGTCWGIPSFCSGSDVDMRKWVPCGPSDMNDPGCVSTCVAIQSRGAYVPAPPGACP